MNFFFNQPQREKINGSIVNNGAVLQINTAPPQTGVVSLTGAPPTLPRRTPVFRQFSIYKVPPLIPSPVHEPPSELPKIEAKMTWGKPTWFLFHTLAEKVIESHFLDVRLQLLDVIYSICVNLPCPKCAEHAKEHLNGVNFNTIRTKDDLKMLLFDFHNLVNARKGYDIFNYEDLKKYEFAITKNVIQNFLIEYNKKSKNIRFIADDLHRDRIASSLRKWFSENFVHFHE